MWLMYLWVIGTYVVTLAFGVFNLWLLGSLLTRNNVDLRRRILSTVSSVAILAASVGAVMLLIGHPWSGFGDAWTGWLFLVFSPVIAVGWVGLYLWWRIAMKTRYSGFCAGAIAGFLSVVIGWLLHAGFWMFASQWVDRIFGREWRGSGNLGFTGDGGGFAVLGEVFFMAISIPIGLIMGGLMGRVQRKLASNPIESGSHLINESP